MRLKPIVFDVLAGVGAVLTFAGLWWIFPPLALLLLGLGMIFVACWGAKRWRGS